MLIVVAFLLVSFIVSAGLILLKHDCGYNFDWIDEAFGDDHRHR